MKYVPHEYQSYATDFILTHPVAAVLLEMGLGKSVITLTAIYELCLDRFETGRVLVSGTGQELLDNPLVQKAYLGVSH